ncbi:zinc knuckle CX2CX4HX4C containing protein [Tanacetum coccineum]
MRTKRNLKIPQNLKDFVHNNNTTQTKNKGTELKKKRGNKVNKNMDTKVNGGQKKDCESNQNVKMRGSSEDREKVDDMNKGDGCVGVVNDEHVTPSPSPSRDNGDEISKDCLNNVDSIKITGSGDSDDLNGSKSEIGTKCDSVKKDGTNEELVNNEKKENVIGTLLRKFSDVVNDNKIDNKLEVISTVIDANGNEVVEMNDEMIEIGCHKWQKTACGFFVGCHVTYNEARYHLKRMWNKFGFINLNINEGGVFLFKFHDEGAMDKVVRNGPWMVNNKPLFV